MSKLDKEFNKKLRGIYKQCINVCSWNKNTKAFRDSLNIKINSLNN